VAIAEGVIQFLQPLDIEPMKGAGSRSVRQNAVVDRDPHLIGHSAGVKELVSDACLLRRPYGLCFNLGGATGGEFAHGEGVAPDAN
jgi:hypothetical protein